MAFYLSGLFSLFSNRWIATHLSKHSSMSTEVITTFQGGVSSTYSVFPGHLLYTPSLALLQYN